MEIKEQDQQLDNLYVSIKNIKTVSKTINRELVEHLNLIDGLDDAVVAEDIRLGRTHSKLKKLNAYRETGYIILVLVAFIVLLVVVILMN